MNTLNEFQNVTSNRRREMLRLAVAAVFIVLITIYTEFLSTGIENGHLLIVAGVIGAYMAMNIGANDVANNVGPAVGSKTLTLGAAIIIAAIFEAAGAIIAGGDVVSTIKKGIIDPSAISDSATFIWLMMSALLAGALWLNFATYYGLPVSTTHSIVGGVLGAGIAAGGINVANWSQMGSIAASWFISPVLGGLIAAGFLMLIKHRINYKRDRIKSARKWVPILIAIMAWAFSTYLIMKGLKKIVKIDFDMAVLYGFGIAAVIYAIVKPMIRRASENLENTKKSINKLFTIPLIFAAALLSFAHGANDVANAVGPLAAITDSLIHGEISTKASIPLWVMLVGAIGIALGLALYGPKLIRTVGSEITELDQTRAFCIAMAASITVIIASQLGLPVSSTHVAIGAVFGVGFLREAIKRNYHKKIAKIKAHYADEESYALDAFLEDFEDADFKEKGKMMRNLKAKGKRMGLSKKDRKALKQTYKNELVARSAALKIASAWIITVPASASLAAIIFYVIQFATS
ncbi:inorganic phosphate transporter [Curvivirga sp.]|uniref:inorganic phosphate transporter n=1 Tax=Curvivirga sp. TaxID=2856848 RepID=UPI003B5C6B28